MAVRVDTAKSFALMSFYEEEFALPMCINDNHEKLQRHLEVLSFELYFDPEILLYKIFIASIVYYSVAIKINHYTSILQGKKSKTALSKRVYIFLSQNINYF